MSASIESQLASLSIQDKDDQECTKKAGADATKNSADDADEVGSCSNGSKGASKSKHVEALEAEDTFKTELCKSYLSGRKCRYGRQCRFAHGMQDLRPRDISTANYKSQACQNWDKTGKCPFGVRCRFLHDEQRVYITPEIYYLLSWSEHYVRLIIPAELSPFKEHRRYRRAAASARSSSSSRLGESDGGSSIENSPDSSPAPESVRSTITGTTITTEASGNTKASKKVHVLVASAPLDFFSGIMMHCAPFFPFAYPVFDCSAQTGVMMIPTPPRVPAAAPSPPFMFYPHAHVPSM